MFLKPGLTLRIVQLTERSVAGKKSRTDSFGVRGAGTKTVYWYCGTFSGKTSQFLRAEFIYRRKM